MAPKLLPLIESLDEPGIVIFFYPLLLDVLLLYVIYEDINEVILLSPGIEEALLLVYAFTIYFFTPLLD